MGTLVLLRENAQELNVQQEAFRSQAFFSTELVCLLVSLTLIWLYNVSRKSIVLILM